MIIETLDDEEDSKTMIDVEVVGGDIFVVLREEIGEYTLEELIEKLLSTRIRFTMTLYYLYSI